MSYSSEVLADSPLIYLRLGDTSGTTAVDSSGNGRSATYVNSPTLGVTGLLAGDTDKAVSLAAASSQYVDYAADATIEALTNWSLEILLKPASTGQSGLGLISRAYDPGTASVPFVLGLGDANIDRPFAGIHAAGVWHKVESPSALSAGTAYHLVATFDGTTIRLYDAGSQVATLTPGVGSPTTNTLGTYFGRRWDTAGGGVVYFDGVIDEAAIYGTALSAARIAAHYAASIPSPLALNAASLSAEDLLASTVLTNTLPLNTASMSSEALLTGTISTDTLIHAATVQSETALSATLSLYQPLGVWTGDDDLRFDSGEELSAWLFLEPTEVSPPAGTHVTNLDQVSVVLPAPTLANGIPVGWTPTVTRTKWGRFQIIVDGTDVTHYRGKRTVVASYASNDPFGDADATLLFPQITEYDTRSSIPWWNKGAEVTIRRRHPDGTKTVVWEGLLASEEPAREVHCLGVLYQLDLYLRTRIFLDEPVDVGHRIASSINERARHHGFKGGYCTPVDTGIDTREQGAGDPLLTSFIQTILATAQNASGQQWALQLDHPRKPVIRLKDTTTQHWTVDNGAPGVSPSLSRDYTQETNVEYGQGSSGDCVWENRKFPNLHPDTAPLYPLTLPSVFNPGDGQSGFAAFADELRDNGRSMDSGDTYVASDFDNVEDFQADAGITVDGIVGPQTWAAAFQTGSHQGDLSGVWVKPLAELSSVEPYLFNAQGATVGDNPAWDSTALRVEKMTLFGDRVAKPLGRKAAKQMLARDHVAGHLGTITLTSDPAEGSRRDIQAGQNIQLRRYQGANLLFHIARAEWDEAGQAMTVTVDTKARDLMTVASVHQRNRDVADPVGRPKPSWHTGGQVSDRVQWACEDGAGKIPFHAQFGGLWTVMRIPAGEYGQIAKVTLAAGSGLTRGVLNDLLADPTPSGYHGYVVSGASKMAVAVFAGEVTANMLANLLGNPLANNGAGNNPWDDNADQLREWGCQYAAGGPGQAAGFYPHNDPGDGTSTGLTGRFSDAAGWTFQARHIPWLWVACYTTSTCYVGGRMYPGAP